jgi:hypothetical protein
MVGIFILYSITVAIAFLISLFQERSGTLRTSIRRVRHGLKADGIN